MESFTVLNNNIDLSSIGGTAFKLFALNKICHGDKNTCQPSQKELAEMAGVCVRTVQRCLKELEKADLIAIQYCIGAPNVYCICNKSGKYLSLRKRGRE